MDDGQGRILLASGGEDIKLWDLSSSSPVKQFSAHSDSISNLSWSYNNQFLASSSASGDKVVLNYVKGSSVIDLATGDNQTCLTLNSSSRYLACSGKNKVITVWDLKTKKLRKQYKGHKGTVTCITFNGNDSHIASGSANGEVIIHNVASGQCGNPLTNPTGEPIRNIQYSYFKKSYLAAVSDDGGLYLWDTNPGKLLASFSNSHKAPATGLAFSPHNNLLLASCGLDKKIICYDVMGKKVIKSMVVDSPLTSLVFLHDGATLAAGSSRGKIFIFDLRKGDAPLKTLVGHKSSIQCLCFQHDTSTTKVNGTSGRSVTTPAQPTARSAAKKSARADHSHRQPSARPQHTVGGVPSVTTNSTPNSNRLQHVTKEDPAPVGNNIGHGDITPLNVDEKEEKSSQQQSSGRLEAVGTETNNYSDNSSLLAGGIFSPMSAESSGTEIRKAPIGSVGHGDSPFSAMQPVRSDVLHRRSNTSPSVNMNNNAPPLSVISPPLDNAANIPTSSATSDSYQSRHNSGDKSSRREKDERESTETNHILTGAIHKRGVSPQPISSEEASTSTNRDAPSRTTSSIRQPQEQPQAASASSRPGGQAVDPFQVEFMRNMIEDAMEEFRDDIHRDMVNMHVEVVRQFQIQQNEIRALLQTYSVNEGLLAEIERLKEENKRLKATF